MDRLFETAKIHTLTLRNRFVRSATWTGTGTADGEVTEEMISRMVELAEGEVGLIISGHAYVQPEGQASPRQLAVYRDRFVDGLRRMVDRIHERGGVVAMQLAHAGMYAIDTAPGPCSVVSKLDDNPEKEQRALDTEDIGRLVEAFVAAGLRAKAAGFDAVELHSGHGYFLSQFLSPCFNKRTDEYGGDVKGRARIHVEILKGLRTALGDAYPILVKMNGRDYADGGLTAEDAAEAARLMEQAGCNAVELSGGLLRNVKLSPSRMGISSEEKEAYFKEDARLIKQAISIPLILVGGVRSLSVAESVLKTGVADFISMSRPLICEPNLIARWRAGDRRPAACKSDNRCFRPGFKGQGVFCPHSPKN